MFGNVRTNNSLSSIRFSVSVHVVNSTKTWTSHPMHCTCTDNPLRVNKGRFWNTKWESEMRKKVCFNTIWEMNAVQCSEVYLSQKNRLICNEWRLKMKQLTKSMSKLFFNSWVVCLVHNILRSAIFNGNELPDHFTHCAQYTSSHEKHEIKFTHRKTQMHMCQTEEILSSFICRQNPHRQTHVVLTLISDSSVV